MLFWVLFEKSFSYSEIKYTYNFKYFNSFEFASHFWTHYSNHLIILFDFLISFLSLSDFLDFSFSDYHLQLMRSFFPSNSQYLLLFFSDFIVLSKTFSTLLNSSAILGFLLFLPIFPSLR